MSVGFGSGSGWDAFDVSSMFLSSSRCVSCLLNCIRFFLWFRSKKHRKTTKTYRSNSKSHAKTSKNHRRNIETQFTKHLQHNSQTIKINSTKLSYVILSPALVLYRSLWVSFDFDILSYALGCFLIPEMFKASTNYTEPFSRHGNINSHTFAYFIGCVMNELLFTRRWLRPYHPAPCVKRTWLVTLALLRNPL